MKNNKKIKAVYIACKGNPITNLQEDLVAE